ncbi:MAG TPA: hypothetical protein VGY66_15245 [Gemmataceae bacterium]|nr:hypothetical protein [Gemmataceae bacterium]
MAGSALGQHSAGEPVVRDTILAIHGGDHGLDLIGGSDLPGYQQAQHSGKLQLQLVRFTLDRVQPLLHRDRHLWS